MHDAGTHADLIAEWNAGSRERGPYVVGQALADALEEADRQLAELERGNRFRESVAEAERERAVAAEAALKVAEDALENVRNSWLLIDADDAHMTHSIEQVEQALAAIRQERKP